MKSIRLQPFVMLNLKNDVELFAHYSGYSTSKL